MRWFLVDMLVGPVRSSIAAIDMDIRSINNALRTIDVGLGTRDAMALSDFLEPYLGTPWIGEPARQRSVGIGSFDSHQDSLRPAGLSAPPDTLYAYNQVSSTQVSPPVFTPQSTEDEPAPPPDPAEKPTPLSRFEGIKSKRRD